MSNTTLMIICILLVILSNIVSFSLGSNSTRKRTDGIIIIDEADEEGHAGMNLQFGIEYEELMKRNTLTFKIENHLVNTKKSQSL